MVNIKRVRTSVPGWYTTEFLERRRKRCKICSGAGCVKCLPEAGAVIRAVVPVSSKGIVQQVRDEEARLQALYGEGVSVHVVPKVKAGEKLDVQLDGQTDADLVQQYIGTLDADGRYTADDLNKYLVATLGQHPSNARFKRLMFRSVECEDVLSFKKLTLNYQKLGLVLLRGVNKDWGGRSNGAGKSTLLSMLTVGLYGQTLKGQRDDKWAREKRSGKRAWIKLAFRDERKRLIEVLRCRPNLLQVFIDGAEQSAGLTGKSKKETQGIIEELAGFDLRMLQNAVYLDQTVSNGFVYGTNKDRMDLLRRFLDLDRYELAKEIADIDLKNARSRRETAILNEAKLDEKLAEQKARVLEEPDAAVDWTVQEKSLTKKIAGLVKRGGELADLQGFYTELQTEIDELESDEASLRQKYTAAQTKLKIVEKQKADALALAKAGICPTCQQECESAALSIAKGYSNILKELTETIRVNEERRTKKLAKLNEQGEAMERYTDEAARIATELNTLRAQLENVTKAAAQEKQRNEALVQRRAELQGLIKQTKQARVKESELVAKLDLDVEMFTVASKALSRNGMPLYLAAAMCPALNAAAEEYSEIFTEGKIRLLFQVFDGEFQVDIVHPTGSETVIGQSVGESAMAGLICAFALRDTAPKTNLLILDEPGTGLDAIGAKQFAQGLLKLKDKYPSIIVTTHNSVIESELAAETTWTVVKEKGVSKLLTA
jgi:DNA repair exonuclease SbcCD ATPase subunit